MSKQATAKTTLTVIDNNSAAQGERRNIPYNQLFLSPLNVRKTPPTQAELIELAGLIKAQGGVIENLIVYPETQKGKETGRFGVAGGGRRWRSTGMLVAELVFSENHPMPCLIVPEDRAIELSLVENSGREDMHPADQFEAFKTLIDGGRDIKDVAAIFSVDEKIVQRRLLLANVAPYFIAEYRAGNIKLGMLEALALTTDHDLQMQAWESLEDWQRTPQGIRAAIMSNKINIDSHPVAKFVGAEAFEKAGGAIEKDLFSEEGDGYIADFLLLMSIANEKLAAAALPFREGGQWAWVDVVPKLDYQTVNSYPRARTADRKATKAETAQIKKLEADMEKINENIGELEEKDDYGDAHEELDTQYEALESQLDTLRNALKVVIPEHKDIAGVLVGIDENGSLKIEVGRVKPEDAKKTKKSASGLTLGDDDGESGKPKAEHSERLTMQLTAQRTTALQEAVTANPRVALVALATQMFVSVCRIGYAHNTVCVSVSLPSLESSGGEVIATDRAYLLMNKRRAAWEQRLVADGCDEMETVYERIAALPETDLQDLLAFCTASTVAAISGSDNRLPFADLLAKETALDMSEWWTPTAANYFGYISKPKVLEVLGEAGVQDESGTWTKMKKGELAIAAEQAMQGKGWIPSLMRAE